MTCYLDDDVDQDLLIRLATARSHRHISPRSLGQSGQHDARNFLYAVSQRTPLMTRNASDFESLHEFALDVGGVRRLAPSANRVLLSAAAEPSEPGGRAVGLFLSAPCPAVAQERKRRGMVLTWSRLVWPSDGHGNMTLAVNSFWQRSHCNTNPVRREFSHNLLRNTVLFKGAPPSYVLVNHHLAKRDEVTSQVVHTHHMNVLHAGLANCNLSFPTT